MERLPEEKILMKADEKSESECALFWRPCDKWVCIFDGKMIFFLYNLINGAAFGLITICGDNLFDLIKVI